MHQADPFDGALTRRQKRVDYLSPVEFEEKHYTDRATPEPVRPGNVPAVLSAAVDDGRRVQSRRAVGAA
ncbi:hypothetical protein [Streptomyces sp. NPDC052107]|uniref:hypothetical protein n=1 Tax=Streptomyces sp. NPDC052107 TaxID=3155632 RepID=UPI003417ABF0